MHRLAARLPRIVLTTAAILGLGLTWTAFGPDLARACPAPALRPADQTWVRADAEIGGLEGPGAIHGSRISWERAVSAAEPRRRLDVLLVDALDGEWGSTSTARGRPARIVATEWPEPGSMAIWWDNGGLGCTIYGVTLSGQGVTEAEAAAAVEALR